MKPAIEIYIDPQTHEVNAKVDGEQVKSWHYVLGLLEMAKGKVNDTIRAAQLKAMQEQTAAQRLNGAVRRQILQG